MNKFFSTSNHALKDTAILLGRVALGMIMFAHGSQKVLGVFGGQGLDATVTGMSAGLHIPLFLAYCAVFSEFFGGIGLLLGIFTRFFALMVATTMLVAVFAVHLSNGFFAPKGFEYPASLAMIGLAILISGPGAFSLDALIYGVRHRKKHGVAPSMK